MKQAKGKRAATHSIQAGGSKAGSGRPSPCGDCQDIGHPEADAGQLGKGGIERQIDWRRK